MSLPTTPLEYPMNPTTPEQLSYAITDSLARTFRLIGRTRM